MVNICAGIDDKERISKLEMNIFHRLILIFYGFALVAAERGALVTHVQHTDLPRSLLFFRSMLTFNYGQFDSHLCISGTDSLKYEDKSLEVLRRFGVRIHITHRIADNSTLHGSTEWKNLICASQVADWYSLQGLENRSVHFVGSNFIVVRELQALMSPSAAPSSLQCSPKLLPLQYNTGRTNQGLCEMDILTISSSIGTEIYSVLNATAQLDVTAEAALDFCVRSLKLRVVFLTEYGRIVRAGRMWYDQSALQTPELIEFDGYNHVIAPITDQYGCAFSLKVEWPQVHKTDGIITRVFQSIYEDERTLNIMAGCADHDLFALFDAEEKERPLSGGSTNRRDSHSSSTSGAKVFDSFMFNDEIALLRLRLEFMNDFVDHFILVESRQTFTGKPKPLHFQKHKHLFSDFEAKIIHVVVEALPFPEVTQPKQVWLNEYFSRNCIADALEHAQASDHDILLLNDVDEIPQRRSIESLRVLLRDTSSLAPDRSIYDRIYKLFGRTYMYDFGCRMSGDALLSAGAPTATTVGIARQLAAPYAASTATSSSSGVGATGAAEQRVDPPADLARSIEQHYISLTRMFMQTTEPFPLQNVIAPGGWHLTFFGGVDHIKRKLQSYSHQNFVSQFVDPVTSSTPFGVADLAAADNISEELITKKIAAGLEIDYRNKRKCIIRNKTNEHLDSEDKEIKDIWDKIYLSGLFNIFNQS